MALDRQAIEKKDFPISRRGYEPEAVDAHLAQLADALEQAERRATDAERSARGASAAPAASSTGARVTSSLAAAASDQVRIIVEAAESSASQIERSAQADADRIRREAEAAAATTRTEAIGRSEEHVTRVGDATGQMLQRVDAMEGELGQLLESLRTGTNRLNADLSLLQGQLGELHDGSGDRAPSAGATRRASAQAPAPTPTPAPEPEPEPEPVAEEEPEVVVVEVVEEDEIVAPSGPVATEEAAAEPEVAQEGDVEGARLIALNMALNGQPRDETDAFLRENFELSDRDGLLDEVYATVEG